MSDGLDRGKNADDEVREPVSGAHAPRHAAHRREADSSSEPLSTTVRDDGNDEGSPDAIDFKEDFHHDEVISKYALSGDAFHGTQESVNLPPKNDYYDMDSYCDTAVDAEAVSKSKKLKVMLIIVLVVLLIGIGALCFWGFNLVGQAHEENTHVVDSSSGSTMTINDTVNAAASLNLQMPELSKLFGQSVDEALAFLGADYQLVATSQVTVPAAADGTEAVVDDNTVTQIAEIDYKQASGKTGSASTATASTTTVANTPKLYLSLNGSGKVLECYATSSLDVLGYPESTFSTLVSTQDALTGVLKNISVNPATDYVYTAPDPAAYTTYAADSDGNATSTIVKEETTFSGYTADQTTRPTTWSVTFTYDYSKMNISGKPTDLSRTVTVKLS